MNEYIRSLIQKGRNGALLAVQFTRAEVVAELKAMCESPSFADKVLPVAIDLNEQLLVQLASGIILASQAYDQQITWRAALVNRDENLRATRAKIFSHT